MMKVVLDNFFKKYVDVLVWYCWKKFKEIENLINLLLEEVKKLDGKFDFEMVNFKSFFIIKLFIYYEVFLIFYGVDFEEIFVEDG